MQLSSSHHPVRLSRLAPNQKPYRLQFLEPFPKTHNCPKRYSAANELRLCFKENIFKRTKSQADHGNDTRNASHPPLLTLNFRHAKLPLAAIFRLTPGILAQCQYCASLFCGISTSRSIRTWLRENIA